MPFSPCIMTLKMSSLIFLHGLFVLSEKFETHDNCFLLVMLTEILAIKFFHMVKHL
jgi:hypothetical protein